MGEFDGKSYWGLGFSLGAAVVAVVAALALTLITTARSIRNHALRIDAVAREIVEHTRPIWGLAQTQEVAVQLVDEVRAIAAHATQLADTLAPVSERRSTRR